MTTQQAKAAELAAEYRPSMTLEVLHAWAVEAAALLRASEGRVPDAEEAARRGFWAGYEYSSLNPSESNIQKAWVARREEVMRLAALTAAPHPPAQQALKTLDRDSISMPQYWSVDVNVDGENIVSIGHEHLSGSRALDERDEETIKGAAQHLLSFVGYGLPPCAFDPDDASPPPHKAEGAEHVDR